MTVPLLLILIAAALRTTTAGTTTQTLLQTSSCGHAGYMTQDNGVIDSHPGFATNQSYSTHLNCTWTIQAPAGKAVQLSAMSFDLEGQSPCTYYDYLELFDGVDGVPCRSLGKFCGSNMTTVTSIQNLLTLHFHTDGSVQKKGFRLQYTFVNASALRHTSSCGHAGYLTQDNGIIDSHPGVATNQNYSNYLDCRWTIQAPAGKVVQLSAICFDLNSLCTNDYLEVFDGVDGVPCRRLRKYCGSSMSTVTSILNFLTLHFHTDGILQYTFVNTSTLRHTSSCGHAGYLTQDNGVIDSHPGFATNQNYSNYLDCRWTIQAPAGKVVQLSANCFDLQISRLCIYDYLEVFDGLCRRLRQICGSRMSTFTSIQNFLTLHFHTDGSVQKKGFRLQYTFVNASALRQTSSCGHAGYLTQDNGVIDSHPGFATNQNYSNNLDCWWTIQAPAGKVVQLSANRFDLESERTCNYDYLDMIDEDGVSCRNLGKFCGSSISNVTSIQNFLTLHFHTDGSNQNKGFRLQYTFVNAPDISVAQFVSVSCKGNAWNVSVDIEKLRQIYPDTTPSDIYMGENTCMGVYNGVTLTFNQGLSECLTSEQISGDKLMYTNELVYAEHDPLFSYIIRHYNWTVSVECDVSSNNSYTATGHMYHDTNNHSHHPVTGSIHYAVNMSFYQDPNFIHPIPGNPLHVKVGTYVYTMVYTPGTDWTVKMRVHTCYTKPTPSSPDHMKYYLMRNGCEVDGNTHIISQSSHETRFVFEDFAYSTNPAGIYVYCDATFCASTDYSRRCTQTCNPITKRSVNSHSDGETEKTWKQITRGDDRISEADDAESEIRDTLTDIGKSGVEFLTRQRRTVYRQIIHTK